MEIQYERARPEDADAVDRLLEQHHLPTDGLRAHLATTIVARRNGDVVGSAALEVCWTDAGTALRSIRSNPNFGK